MARLLTVLSERKNMYEEYKGSLKRASKTPDAKLPSIESLRTSPSLTAAIVDDSPAFRGQGRCQACR